MNIYFRLTSITKGAILFIILTSNFVLAQIGINTSNINNNSLFHISEKDDLNSITKKGVMIPRLTNLERDELTYVNLLDNPRVIKLTEFDNSLIIFNTSENCFNFWNSTESIWKSLCGNSNSAEYNFGSTSCPEIRVYGNYVNSKRLNDSNYMTISNIVVTKPGDYSITLEPNNNNGYIFKGEGTFNTVGNHSVTLYASGTPLNLQTGYPPEFSRVS